MKIDIWLKRIWLIIGCLILLAIVIAGIASVVSILNPLNREGGILIGEKATPSGPDSVVTQDFTFSSPRRVGKTDLLYVGVQIKQLSSPMSKRKSSGNEAVYSSRIVHKDGYSDANLINIIFAKSDGAESRLLLNRKAYIKNADIPSPDDSLKHYALYLIAFVDTDHDGRLSEEDECQLFMSDVTGENLTQVTPTGQYVKWYQESSDGKKIYVHLSQKPATGDFPVSDWPEQVCILDVKTRKLSSFSTGSATIMELRKILHEK